MNGLLVLQIVIVLLYLWWRCLGYGDFDPIQEGIYLIIFIFVFALISRFPAVLEEESSVYAPARGGRARGARACPRRLIAAIHVGGSSRTSANPRRIR